MVVVAVEKIMVNTKNWCAVLLFSGSRRHYRLAVSTRYLSMSHTI
jgi:hypothetical protein